MPVTKASLVTLLIVAFACFYGIASYPLLDNNEGLYAAIGRDMLANGQFIIPHLNGVPYLEKPPLLYWLLGLSFRLFGVNAGAAHLVPAGAFFVTACAMQRFIRRQTGNDEAANAAAIVFATSLPLLAMGRMILCDMLMTCLLTLALVCFYERRMLALYALLALAVLTKGFVTLILAGGAMAATLAWRRAPWGEWVALLPPRGIGLFLLIAAPWHIAASLQQPGFAWFYFINEHLFRFLNMREPHDYYTGPPWYYLPRLLAYLLPWTPLFGLIFRSDGQEAGLRHFLWAWFLFFLAFFSIAGAKANYYMIAGMPPLAMLLGLSLRRHPPVAPAAACLGLIAIGLTAGRLFCFEGSGDFYPACSAIGWPAITAIAGYILLALALCRFAAPRWAMPALGAHVFILLPVLIAGLSGAGTHVSQREVADFLLGKGDQSVAIYQEFEEVSALAFYLPEPLTIVDSVSSDLLYGRHLNPANPRFQTLAQWAAQSPRRKLVLLNERLGGVMTSLHNLPGELDGICVLQRFERVSVLGACEGAPHG